MKQKKTLGEQIGELQPKLQTFKERQQAQFEQQKAKEIPETYAVLGSEKLTDLYNLERAKKIAKETNGKVWAMVREGENIEFLYPID